MISVANIQRLAKKYDLTLCRGAISNDIIYKDKTCARGVLAVEAYGSVGEFKTQWENQGYGHAGIYADFVPNQLNVSMSDLDALEDGFEGGDVLDWPEESQYAWYVGNDLRQFVATRV